MKFRRLVVSILAVGLLAGLVVASGCSEKKEESTSTGSKAVEAKSEKKAETSKRSEYFVTTDWLKGHSNDVVIWDARAAKDYSAGHIKGAINAIWQTFADVTTGKPGDKGWGTLLPADKIAEQLGKLGIDTKKTIVVYTDPTGWNEDGRIAWTLKVAGIDNVKMLDGGFAAWKAAGGEISKDATCLPATTVEVASLDEKLNATTDYIKDNDSIKILDVRAKKEYDGATDYGEKRGGHLPNAINLSVKDLLNDDGTLKSDADLRALFDKAGIKEEDTIVSYCTKGIRSAYMTLVLQMLGYDNAKNYDASYYEWAGNTALPLGH